MWPQYVIPATISRGKGGHKRLFASTNRENTRFAAILLAQTPILFFRAAQR